MKIEFKDYRIGFLTGLFEVSADTIRLYAKKDLLEPKKNESNKYRLFCREDVFNMEYIMRLRDMGIPLEDIRTIVCESSLDDVSGRVENRLAYVEEEIAHLAEVRENLKSYRQLLMDISEKTNKIEIIEEKTTFLMIDIEESVPKTIEYLKDLDEDLRPYFSLYVPQEDNPLFTNEDFLDKKKRQEVSFVLTCEDVNGISLQPGFPSDRISVIGPCRFVTSIGYAYTDIKYEFLEMIGQFIQRRGLRRCGNYFTQYLTSQHIHGDAIDYYRTYVPIE
ncbi:MAG: MerR family transcriptional regulator [Anaerovoracaceae bacterium]